LCRLSRNHFCVKFSDKIFHAVYILFSAIFLFGIYCNTLSSPFLFDDLINIVNNQNLQIDRFGLKEIGNIFAEENPCQNRPLAYVSFAWNFSLGKLDPWGYHIFNIVVHVLNCLLLYLFLLQTIHSSWMQDAYRQQGRWLACFAALAWAAHPIQTNAVTYIVQRMTSLAAFFGLLSLVLWMKGRSWWIEEHRKGAGIFFGLAMTSWGAGLLCKENIAILPILIVVHENLLVRDSGCAVRWRWVWTAVLSAGAMCFLYLGKEPVGFLAAAYGQRDFTITERLMTESRVLWHYLSLFFRPEASRFCLLYEYEISQGIFKPITTMASLLGWLIVCWLALFYRRKKIIVIWCVLWFFVAHSVESSFIPLEVIYEHRMYVPSIAITFASVILAYDLCMRLHIRSHIYGLIGGFILCLLASSTYIRNMDYTHAVHFYTSELSKSPGSKRVRLNLAISLIRSGAVNAGGSMLQRLEKDYPEDVHVLQSLHNYVVYELGNEDRAEEIFRQIERVLRPKGCVLKKDTFALWNLAVYYQERGQYGRTLFLLDRMPSELDCEGVRLLRERCLFVGNRVNEAAGGIRTDPPEKALKIP